MPTLPCCCIGSFGTLAVFLCLNAAVGLGAQHSFWGWGKEDNNMVRRLQLHGMWPPERPQVPARPKASGLHSRFHPRVVASDNELRAFANGMLRSFKFTLELSCECICRAPIGYTSTIRGSSQWSSRTTPSETWRA